MIGFELIDIAREIMGPECRVRDWATEAEENKHVYKAVVQAQRVLDLWNTRAPDPAVAVLEAEVARLRGDMAWWWANGREAERIFVASLLADEIVVLTNSPSSFDVQDGIALTAFQKRLIGLWRVRDRLPSPSEKEAG